MVTIRTRPRLLLTGIVLALICVGGLALANQSQSASTSPVLTQTFAVRSPGVHPRPSPRFYQTGGPFVGEAQALTRARGIRIPGSPVAREEVHLMSYGEVVRWIGSENLYYDRGREMYVVAVSGAYEPRLSPLQQPNATPLICNSYFMVMDATDGTVLSVGCGGAAAWPVSLPSPFSR